MSNKTNIPLPRWLREMPDSPEKRRNKTTFFLRIAALYATQSGTMGSLSELCGKPPRYFRDVAFNANRGVIQPDVAASIEKVVGREVLPRDILAPGVFER